MRYTKQLTFFVTLIFLFVQASASTIELYGEQAHQVLSEWFDVDPTFDIQMQQLPLGEDHLGMKYSLTFISDDQQPVNGTLALPQGYQADSHQPYKLALLLHAMGTDQNLWFNSERSIKAGLISDHLRQSGYAVLALDARLHGSRTIKGMGPREILGKAHSPNRRIYNDMIVGTVRDYRLALQWIESTHPIVASHTAAFGYSMGAQMSLLLAAYEPSIMHVVSMVPPYVGVAESPVAPRHHVSNIKSAQILLLAATQDQYTSQAEYQQVFDLIASNNKKVKFFDSGHRLPDGFHDVVLAFIDENMGGEAQ